jgi:hypothetical protein
VHAVEAAQKGRLAAARRADQRRDALLADLDVEALERLDRTVIKGQLLGPRLDDDALALARRLPACLDGGTRRGEPAVGRMGCRAGARRAIGRPDPVCMVLTS